MIYKLPKQYISVAIVGTSKLQLTEKDVPNKLWDSLKDDPESLLLTATANQIIDNAINLCLEKYNEQTTTIS